MRLPQPQLDSHFSLEKAISLRRSVRGYKDEPLGLAQLSQLLWAAQGTTDNSGHRATPSAGATYPLEIYIMAGRVSGLEPGIYHYRCQSHEIEQVAAGDSRTLLSQAANGQSTIEDAPASLVIAAVRQRTEQRYGERARRYIAMEAGLVAQYISLQAVALGLGTVVVGAFNDDKIGHILELGEAVPLYIMPVGAQET
jgi:SagB-type dehydrogenase family enzyme